jgi:putative restriction endonuclease
VDDFLAAFNNLNVWAKGSRRAPHKPLLILLALGRWANGNRDPIPFAEVEEPLQNLLTEFGPPRASSPEEPFWRLRRDGVWELGGTERLPAPSAAAPPGVTMLRAGVNGQFAPHVRDALTADPGLVAKIARSILDAHFSESLHSDILGAVGLDLASTHEVAPVEQPAQRRRDPSFRERVCMAYGDRCAVCGVGMRFARTNIVIGIEAAHLMWFEAGGPDEVSNGLALCVLHHKAFDRGAFTLEHEGKILVSSELCGEGSHEAMIRQHNQDVARPAVAEDRPSKKYLEWHREEVFRGRVRS